MADSFQYVECGRTTGDRGWESCPLSHRLESLPYGVLVLNVSGFFLPNVSSNVPNDKMEGIYFVRSTILMESSTSPQPRLSTNNPFFYLVHSHPTIATRLSHQLHHARTSSQTSNLYNSLSLECTLSFSGFLIYRNSCSCFLYHGRYNNRIESNRHHPSTTDNRQPTPTDNLKSPSLLYTFLHLFHGTTLFHVPNTITIVHPTPLLHHPLRRLLVPNSQILALFIVPLVHSRSFPTTFNRYRYDAPSFLL